MRFLGRSALVLSLSMAIAAIGLTAAPAATTTTAKSTVTITSGKGTEFTGKVTSPQKRCRAGRTVKLYREDGSSRVAYSAVGTAKTNAMGLWTMEGSFLAGFYYARVAPLLIHVNGKPIRCAFDISMRQHF
jgi:hypothetical protein